MSTRILKLSIIGSSFLALFSGLTYAQEQNPPVRYTVTDLGPVGPPPGQPFVLSRDGFVSGQVIVPDGAGSVSHAFVWHGTAPKDISAPGLGGANSAAFGVNLWGQVVGEAENSKLDPHGEDFCGFLTLGFSSRATSCLPFLYEGGVMTALPTLGDNAGHNGQAWQINTFGVAVGSSENATPDSTCPGLPVSRQFYEFKPVVWYWSFFSAKPVVQELQTVSGDPDGVAFAINDRGQAVGGTGSCGPFNAINQINLVPVHAVLWQEGKSIDLGNLGGDGHFNGIFATGLNNVGQVVGVSDTTGDASFHGFLWNEGHMADLAPLSGDSYSYATAISDRGQVVGLSLDANFNLRAVFWQNGTITNLNDLVPAETPLFLQTACSINGKGQITGIALTKGTANDFHAYLATPLRD